MKNDWITTEIALLRERYAVTSSCAELMALFPRHTPGSVRRTARIEGLSRPRAGVVKFRPGRDRMLKLLDSEGPLTSREIGERLGIKYRAVENLKAMYRSDFRIAGWVPAPNGGKWSPKWGVANGMRDEPKPFRSKGSRIGRKSNNPFAAAAGLVSAPTGSMGRVYIHLTDSNDDEELAA